MECNNLIFFFLSYVLREFQINDLLLQYSTSLNATLIIVQVTQNLKVFIHALTLHFMNSKLAITFRKAELHGRILNSVALSQVSLSSYIKGDKYLFKSTSCN